MMNADIFSYYPMDEIRYVNFTTALLRDWKGGSDMLLQIRKFEKCESIVGNGVCFKSEAELCVNPFHQTNISFTALWVYFHDQK